MREKRTLRQGMQTKILKQPNSEKTNRRKTCRLNRNIKRIERKYSPHKRKKIKLKRQEKHYIPTVKIKQKKEFIIDTRSPITIMPPDEEILESTGIQKLTDKYQDVNKNEV